MTDPDEVETLAVRLLAATDAHGLCTLVDEHAELVRSDELDGQLALRSSRARATPLVRDRIGALRHAVELARTGGFFADPRPASEWFRWLFEPGEAFVATGPPPPEGPAPEGLSDLDRLLGDLAFALVLAQSWEERRRLLVAHAHLGEMVDGILQALSGQFPQAATVLTVVREGRRIGLDAACAAAPPLTTAHTFPPPVDAAYLTDDERLQLAWLAYLESPTWHRRHEVLRGNEVLLAPESAGLLGRLWDEVGSSYPDAMVGPARAALDRARAGGSVLDETGPTSVTKGPATRALATGSGAARVSALRALTHFFDPGCWPTQHARMSQLLAESLVEEGTDSAVTAEEASWRAAEAYADLTGGAVDDPLTREVRVTLGRVQLRRQRGPVDEHLEAAITLLDGIEEARADLAFALLLRVSGVPSENALRALDLATAELGSATEDAERAQAHLIAGSALHQLLPGGDQRAVDHLEAALALSPEGSRDAMSAHHHLGSVLAARGPAAHTEAMKHLGAAAAALDREREPVRWAQAQEAIGNALLRGRPTDPEAWVEARGRFATALSEYDDTPLLQLRCGVSLATTWFRAHDWAQALAVYRELLALADQLGDYESTEAGRLSLVSSLRGVHERAAFCHVRLDQPWEALGVLESGRLTELRRLYGGQRWAEEPDVAGLVERLPGPVVLPVVTAEGAVALLLTRNGMRVVELPGFTDADLRLLLDGDPSAGRRGWLFAYREMLAAGEDEALDSPDPQVRAAAEEAAEAAFGTWQDEIGRALDDLGRLLVGPLVEALRGAGVAEGERLRIVPSKWLSLLPLHAAALPDGRALVDVHPVSVLPALWLLDLDARAARPAYLTALVADELPHAAGEAAAVAATFGSSRLLRADTEGVQALAGLLDRTTHLHLVCHGTFDWAHPAGSGLLLSDGRLLGTELLARLPLGDTELVTLAACESGMTESDRTPTELIGLPGSLLAAGARTVLSSLWVVDDEVTAGFMADFYTRLLADGDAAGALAQAQRSLRDAGHSDPFTWAAFALVDRR